MTERAVISSDSPYFPDGAAVVVGGSGGIGREVCRRLADHGTDIALTYRSNRDAGDETARLVEAAGRRAYASSLELTDATAVASFCDDVATRFGRVHTVVFAVGADIPMVYASAVEQSDWQRTIDGDLTGFFNVIRAAVPHLRSGGGGSVVAVTSAGLRRHPQKDVLSTVPKAGIEALVRALAREEGRFGIRANSVALGVVDAGHFHRVEQTLGEEFVAAIKRNTAVQRLGTAREAADAVVFLASSVSGYTTGHSLTVDGGFSV